MGPPTAVRIGEGVAGDRAKETGLGEKTVTPTFCPDMKGKLEIPLTKLNSLLILKTFISCFTNKNSKHKFLDNAEQNPNSTWGH